MSCSACAIRSAATTAASAADGEAAGAAAAGSAPRSAQWRLYYSTMAPGSFGHEAPGGLVPVTAEPCEFTAASSRGGTSSSSSLSAPAAASEATAAAPSSLDTSQRPLSLETRHVVLEWQPAAFSGRGHYDRAKVEADEADRAGIGCGRQPAGERGKPQGKAIELHECLDLFSREETLDSENCWYCDRCKEHREASKKLQIWSLPSVLVVHLKRFSASGMWRRKNDTPVDFPFEIDLGPYQLQHSDGAPRMYDLTAVSNHYGSTGGGHYTAFAKHSESGVWYKFDDSHTSPVEPKDVVTPAAYVLLYVRREAPGDARGGGSPEM